MPDNYGRMTSSEAPQALQDFCYPKSQSGNRYKFIHFVETEKKPKTSTWECRNNNSDYVLGVVKWYGPWRQYCFFPEPIDGLVFNDACLKDICHFMGKLRGEKSCLKDICHFMGKLRGEK